MDDKAGSSNGIRRLKGRGIEWNSTPEVEKAPQGLASDRGRAEGAEGVEGWNH